MKLADWLEKSHLTDTEFAARVGVDQSTINRIRRGLKRPSWPLAERIAGATDRQVMANDFLTET